MSHEDTPPDQNSKAYLRCVRLFSRGDQKKAFEQLVRWYQRKLLAFARAQPGVGPHAAEDIVQDLWIHAQKNCKQFKGGNIQAWLFQKLRWMITDHQRKSSRRKTVEFGDNDQSEKMGVEKSVEDQIISEEEQAIFVECMETVGGIGVRILQMKLENMKGQRLRNSWSYP